MILDINLDKEWLELVCQTINRVYGTNYKAEEIIKAYTIAERVNSIFGDIIERNHRKKQEEAISRSDAGIALSEKGVQLAEETNKLLREILEVLKNKN